MKKELHEKQKAIFELLKRGEEGLSLRDIAREVNLSSPNTVQYHIRQLEKKGYLRRNPTNSSDYILLKDPVKDISYVNVYGTARCGPSGLLVQENVLERVPLSTRMFGVTEHVFLIKACGDSMEPYVFENDMVLVCSQSIVENGEVAVIVCNGEAKIKKVIFAGKQIILESYNPKYRPQIIIEDDTFHVAGKVKSVIKFY